MSEFTFNELIQILERLSLLLQKEQVYEFITSFWNRGKFCFASNDPSIDRVNVTTTCFCLFTILQDDYLKSRFSKNYKSTSGEEPFTKISEVLLSTDWKSENLDLFNIYTTPIVITALHKLNNQFNKQKIIKGLTKILEDIKMKGAASYGDYSPSAFLTYWCAKALEGSVLHAELQKELRDNCRSALDNINAWAELEIYKQLALYHAVDLASFDPIQLAYSLVIYVEASQREKKKVNEKIIYKAIEVISSSQLPDGLWPKCHPIFHYGTRGNVYTFSFEMLDVLLSISSFFPDIFCLYLKNLYASLRWAEQNILIHEKAIHKLKGWRSNLLLFKDGPEAWSTAAVFNALRRMKSLVLRRLNDDILSEFNAKRFGMADTTSFDSLYDCDIKLPKETDSLKNTIQKYLIEPHLPNGNHTDRRYSAIFFGPPGTAKTRLAESIASSLGWPFVHLQTGDFLIEGLDRVAGRAEYIFNKLCLLEYAVILFDEVEEFVRDREDKELPPPSRMITTTMLTLIQQLRRLSKVIFIIATNRLKAFDVAVQRPGRFDLLLLISPPSLPEKKRRFLDRISEIPSIRDDDVFVNLFYKFVNENYKDCIQFFSFLEWDSFLTNIINDFITKDTLTPAQLKEILNFYKDSIIIREELRKDYENSQKMIRIF